MSRSALELACGLARGSARRAERGEFSPRRATLAPWLAALGLGVHEAAVFLRRHRAGICPPGRVASRRPRPGPAAPAWNDALPGPPADVPGLGGELWAIRVHVGLSRPELAALLGVSRSHVLAVERGLRRPSADLLVRWVAVLAPEDPALAVRLVAKYSTAMARPAGP